MKVAATRLPSGAVNRRYSQFSQVNGAFPNPTESIPPARYMKGDTRYMKIQKPGSVLFDARTLIRQPHFSHVDSPAKDQAEREHQIRDIATVSALGIPASDPRHHSLCVVPAS